MQSGYEGYELTAAAERVLDEAAHWASACNGNELPPGALLLGLLAESECRAAQWLRTRAIDRGDVLAHFPGLERLGVATASASRSPAWLRPLLRAADSLFATQPRPTTVATEHLLLGLLTANRDMAEWIDSTGEAIRELAAEMSQRLGLPLASSNQSSEPVALDPEATGAIEGVAESSLVGPDDETHEQRQDTSSDQPSEDVVEPTIPVNSGADRQPISVEPDLPLGVWRILDAAANRAGEGLRVVEDYARFVLDNRRLVEQLKSMRHELAATVGRLPVQRLLAARDTPGDVGTGVSTASELARGDLAAVVAANLKRAAEALRSLEEYAKLIDPTAAIEFERLRYRSYTLAKELRLSGDRRDLLSQARLYVLIDGCTGRAEDEAQACAKFEQLVESLIDAGVDALQFRDKGLGDALLMERARRLRRLTRGSRTLAIVNDRADIAAASGADGVHVGQEELSVADARAIVGSHALVGVSTHSLAQAAAAVLAGADYIGAGPTFPSATKQFADFPGLEYLREVAEQITLPAFAIGGVNLENIDQVLATGIRRVAVRDAITSAENPAATARAFRERILAR